MNFNDIIGQENIINKLKAALEQGTVGHAYIFSGPKGIGKSTIAKIFANLLLCSNIQSKNPCGKCLSCQMINEQTNPDYYEIHTDGYSIGVEEIRNLQNDIVIKPIYSKKKVYIIKDAHKMTVQAQNCLLKTLEEPPDYATIILTVSSYESLLETIHSRTIRYIFQKNSVSEVKKVITLHKANDMIDEDFIAAYSDGIIGTAIELLNSNEFSFIREKSINLSINASKGNLLSVFDAYSFFEENKEKIDIILDIMILTFRDLLICKTLNQKKLINSDKKDIILNNASFFTEKSLYKNIEAIEETRKNIKQNSNYQLSIEVMLLKLQED